MTGASSANHDAGILMRDTSIKVAGAGVIQLEISTFTKHTITNKRHDPFILSFSIDSGCEEGLTAHV